jgi:hypothetical protein
MIIDYQDYKQRSKPYEEIDDLFFYIFKIQLAYVIA